MAVSSAGLRLKSDCSGKDQKQLYSKLTDLSSRQRGRYKIINPQLSKRNFEEKEKLVTGPRWAQINFRFRKQILEWNAATFNFVSLVGCWLHCVCLSPFAAGIVTE
jgi:hypothetical protein